MHCIVQYCIVLYCTDSTTCSRPSATRSCRAPSPTTRSTTDSMPRYLKALPQIYTCEVYRSIQKLATTRRCHKQPVVNWGLLATSSCEDSFLKKNWYTESGIPSKLEGAHVRNSCLEKISKTTATKKLHLLFGRIFPLILGWFC